MTITPSSMDTVINSASGPTMMPHSHVSNTSGIDSNSDLNIVEFKGVPGGTVRGCGAAAASSGSQSCAMLPPYPLGGFFLFWVIVGWIGRYLI